MANYTNEYDAVWDWLSTHTLKDVTSDIATKINEVKNLMAQGKYQSAARAVEDYDLKEYIMCADYINAIDEKTRNLEIECKSAGQCIFYDQVEPTTSAVEGDVWIV